MKTTCERTKRFFEWASAQYLLIAVVIILGGGPAAPAQAQPPVQSMLVTTATIPGWGGPGPAPCGTNPAYLQPVLRFALEGTGPLTPLVSIPPCPASLVNDPRDVAFNSHGELFVANRHGIVAGELGSIARFTFDSDGNVVANGVITGNSLEAVQGLTFNPAGELFAANFLNGTISRFGFDAAGNAVPNGTIAGFVYPEALAFSPEGELFVTHSFSLISRYLFDPHTGAAVYNGTFTIPGEIQFAGLAFNDSGELFIASVYSNLVFRYRFDSAGNLVPVGAISAAGAPLGIAFSSAGELFVTGHFSGGISRFLFDANGNAYSNGFVSTSTLGGVAIFDNVILVSIDIKPGSAVNSVNPRSNGRIVVAILTTDTFDASTVDTSTVHFGATGTEATPVHAAREDVDGDARLDLILHFDTGQTGIRCGASSAPLTGKSFGGQFIRGSDLIRTVGCK
jgi:hypothetical protein